MKNQEAEFQCSECGATVLTDAEVCPYCGEKFEELSDDDYLEIKIPPNLVDTLSIKLLLDESNIEYSIIDNALENILGPSVNVVPKLLVRRNQADLVTQLISALEVEYYWIGAFYSVGNEENGYRIAKILATDDLGVHIKLYSNHYLQRPDKLDPHELFMNSITDDTENFAWGHFPLSYQSFEAWSPEFMSHGEIAENELEGYEIWKKGKGGYF